MIFLLGLLLLIGIFITMITVGFGLLVVKILAWLISVGIGLFFLALIF